MPAYSHQHANTPGPVFQSAIAATPLSTTLHDASQQTGHPPDLNSATPDLLQIHAFTLKRGRAAVLDKVSLSLKAGRTLGLLGESGAGKSTLAMAIIGLLTAPQVDVQGSLKFADIELVGLPEKQFQKLRGSRIGLIFQDATASLDPCFTIGQQICEPLRRHLKLSRKQAIERAVALLDSVGIPDARARLSAFPHQLSGGMQQRVMISIALACDPELLIADEPTSALDVTIQAQIMELILRRVRSLGSSAIFVLHDLALASQVCDDIAVMYGGQIVETGPADAVLRRPLHPYTVGLRSCVVELDSERLVPLPGTMPGADQMPEGCRFASRCAYRQARCDTTRPPLEMRDGRLLACWRIDEIMTGSAA
ncbi:ABC transporter ATP-binding protein [Pigmentiphaga aceris]|nr:ABC transporter ATP-binding protein [Pigmentiphaga aceris]